MAQNNQVFAIDDTVGTSENLNVYAQVLERIDSELGASLRPYLALLAAGSWVDAATVLQALYAATDPNYASSATGAA
jgi:flagellum-specific peptidoglycan hydrolase FlgJ